MLLPTIYQLMARRDRTVDPAERRRLDLLLANLAAGEVAGRGILQVIGVGADPPPGTIDAGERAARDFANLVAEIIAVRLAVEDNAEKFADEFKRSFAEWIKGLDRWQRKVSGADIPWWDFPSQLSKSLWIVFSQREIYNEVQVFRQEFKKYHDTAEKTLGRAPLGVPSEKPSPFLSVTPTKDWIKELAGTALTIVLVGGGAYIIGSALSGRASSSNLNLKLAAVRPAAAAGAGQ